MDMSALKARRIEAIEAIRRAVEEEKKRRAMRTPISRSEIENIFREDFHLSRAAAAAWSGRQVAAQRPLAAVS